MKVESSRDDHIVSVINRVQCMECERHLKGCIVDEGDTQVLHNGHSNIAWNRGDGTHLYTCVGDCSVKYNKRREEVAQ